jgi:hypothetical protein
MRQTLPLEKAGVALRPQLLPVGLLAPPKERISLIFSDTWK